MCFGMQARNRTFTYAMTYICMSDHTLLRLLRLGASLRLAVGVASEGRRAACFWQRRGELPPRIRLMRPEHQTLHQT